MSKKDIILAIDTSNYTTSLAAVSLAGELISNIKIPLSVESGQHGLRQSDALFAHVKNIPLAFDRARDIFSESNIVAVGVSSKPRNIEGSYMPVFLAGVSAAEAISKSLGVPLYTFSHQCGHIMAALYSAGKEQLMTEGFAALHISGGTTELLKVDAASYGFNTEIVGKTLDLNAGQVIDRVGVKLGMPFPAGAHLEKAALEFSGKVPHKKISVSGMDMNLSGLENMADAMFKETNNVSLVSSFVLEHIARTIAAVMRNYISKHGKTKFILAGGVMSNSIIKKEILSEFDAYFAEPALSSDNAVGIAVLALREFLSSK